MSRILIGLTVIAFAGPPGETSTEQEKRALQRKVARLRMAAESIRTARLREDQDFMAEYEARLRKAKRGKIDPDNARFARFTYADRREKRRVIQEERAQLAEFEAFVAHWRGACTIIPALPNPPRVGDLGELPYIRVLQIIDADEMRVKTRHGRDLWLRGVVTRGHVDGVRLKPAGIFEVTTTKTYTTALGAARTVLAAEPVPIPLEMLRLEPIETKGKKRRRPR